jgi:hypothetical protein
MKQLYVVQLVMSSQNKINHTERIDEYTIETEFKFDEETRQKISAARMATRTQVYAGSVDFCGLQIVNEEAIPRIEKAVKEGRDRLTAIVPGLRCDMVLIGLDAEAMRKGEMARRIVDSILYQVYREIADRLTAVLQKRDVLPEVSKKAILTALDRMKALNVIEDPDVDAKIEAIIKMVNEDAIQPLKTQLDTDLKLLTTRWAYLEFKEEDKAPRGKRKKKTEAEGKAAGTAPAA